MEIKMPKKKTSYYSIPQVAKLLGVSRNLPLYWLKKGWITAVVKNPMTDRPQYLVDEDQVRAMQEKLNVTPKLPA